MLQIKADIRCKVQTETPDKGTKPVEIDRPPCRVGQNRTESVVPICEPHLDSKLLSITEFLQLVDLGQRLLVIQKEVGKDFAEVGPRDGLVEELTNVEKPSCW